MGLVAIWRWRHVPQYSKYWLTRNQSFFVLSVSFSDISSGLIFAPDVHFLSRRLPVQDSDQQRDPAAPGGREAPHPQGEVVEAEEGRRKVQGNSSRNLRFAQNFIYLHSPLALLIQSIV